MKGPFDGLLEELAEKTDALVQLRADVVALCGRIAAEAGASSPGAAIAAAMVAATAPAAPPPRAPRLPPPPKAKAPPPPAPKGKAKRRARRPARVERPRRGGAVDPATASLFGSTPREGKTLREQILEVVAERGQAKAPEIVGALPGREDSARRTLHKMTQDGDLVRKGDGYKVVYELPKLAG